MELPAVLRRAAFLSVDQYAKTTLTKTPLLLSGPRGVGKSTLLGRAVQFWRSQGRTVLDLDVRPHELRNLDSVLFSLETETVRSITGFASRQQDPVAYLLETLSGRSSVDVELRNFVTALATGVCVCGSDSM
jgi:hypothetical protein